MGGLAWGLSRAVGSSWINASGTQEQPLWGFSGLQGGRRRGRGQKRVTEDPLCQQPPQLGLSLRALPSFGEQVSSYPLDMPGPQLSATSRTTGAVACLAEVLLWVGGSVVVSPRWQLSLLGKKGKRQVPPEDWPSPVGPWDA